MEQSIPVTTPRKVISLTQEERDFIAGKWPHIVVDEEGYYITNAGKPRSARTLLGLRQAPPPVVAKMNEARREDSRAMWAHFLKLLEQGLQPAQAAKKIGVRPQQVNRRKNTDPEFKEAIAEARAIATEKVVNAMFESALNGNFQAQNKILEQLDPETWKADKTIKIEQTTVHEISATDSMAKITALMARLEERRALTEGYIDAEVISETIHLAEEPTD